MIFILISSLLLFFNWQRLMFILISLEFIIISLFILFSGSLNEMMFFFILCVLMLFLVF